MAEMGGWYGTENEQVETQEEEEDYIKSSKSEEEGRCQN